MRAEEFADLVDRRPFTPLRLHLTDGWKFDIRHPDQVIVLRSRIDIGVPPHPGSRIMERVEYCSLENVARVKELANGKARPPRKKKR